MAEINMHNMHDDEEAAESWENKLDDFIDFERLEMMPPYLTNKSHF